MRYAAFVASLACLVTFAASCRSVREVQTVTDTFEVHDTTEIFVHDTTTIREIVHDSVDRYVERNIYIDTNGVIHEKEIQILNHYIYNLEDEYRSNESYYKNKIKELERSIDEGVKVEYIEKSLNWLQKTLMVCGVCFLVLLLVVLFRFLNRKK